MCRTKQRTGYLVGSSPCRVFKPVFATVFAVAAGAPVFTPLLPVVAPDVRFELSRVDVAGALFVLSHNHTRIVGVVAVVNALGQQIEIVECQKKIPYESQLEKKAFSHWAG